MADRVPPASFQRLEITVRLETRRFSERTVTAQLTRANLVEGEPDVRTQASKLLFEALDEIGNGCPELVRRRVRGG